MIPKSWSARLWHRHRTYGYFLYKKAGFQCLNTRCPDRVLTQTLVLPSSIQAQACQQSGCSDHLVRRGLQCHSIQSRWHICIWEIVIDFIHFQTMSYGTLASASNTFIWPGNLPATGWMAKRTCLPWRAGAGQFGNTLLGLRHCHTITWNDNDVVSISNAVATPSVSTATCSPSTSICGPAAPPNPPRITLMKDRFIALHIM